MLLWALRLLAYSLAFVAACANVAKEAAVGHKLAIASPGNQKPNSSDKKVYYSPNRHQTLAPKRERKAARKSEKENEKTIQRPEPIPGRTLKNPLNSSWRNGRLNYRLQQLQRRSPLNCKLPAPVIPRLTPLGNGPLTLWTRGCEQKTTSKTQQLKEMAIKRKTTQNAQ